MSHKCGFEENLKSGQARYFQAKARLPGTDRRNFRQSVESRVVHSFAHASSIELSCRQYNDIALGGGYAGDVMSESRFFDRKPTWLLTF